MGMVNNDFSKFVHRISIDSSQKNLYEAWSIPEKLESWLLSSAEFTDINDIAKPKKTYIEEKDTYVWKWFGFPGFVEKGKILWANEKDFLEFTFSGGCIVSIRIKRESGENICELTQMMPHEQVEDRLHFYIECGKSWAFYLTNLKSVLEGGLDLRNKNDNLTNVVNS
jgi:hypothetical protein